MGSCKAVAGQLCLSCYYCRFRWFGRCRQHLSMPSPRQLAETCELTDQFSTPYTCLHWDAAIVGLGAGGAKQVGAGAIMCGVLVVVWFCVAGEKVNAEWKLEWCWEILRKVQYIYIYLQRDHIPLCWFLFLSQGLLLIPLYHCYCQ